ncbi:transglutaminase domain-containing protein [Candidatus Uhrbacteria bacterium]|nr:transglutaminase domain-containing protein [Candidatus Uhrbacteria bacterium]
MREFRMRSFTAFLAFSLIFTSFPASTFAQTSTPDTLPDATDSQGVFVSGDSSSTDVFPIKAGDSEATSIPSQDSLPANTNNEGSVKDIEITPSSSATSSSVIGPVASSTTTIEEYGSKNIENKGNIAPHELVEQAVKLTYPELMREFRAVQLGKEYDDTPFTDTDREVRRAALLVNLTEYAKTEVQSLRELGVSAAKQSKFLSSIHEKIRALGGAPTWWDKIKAFFADFFGMEQQPSIKVIIKDDVTETAAIPEKPSSFSPATDTPPALTTKEVEIEGQALPDDPTLQETLKNLIITQKVEAADNDLPILKDLTGEDSEITISFEIHQLADSLDRNPAKIFNFVRNQIAYEPYPGSKKGAVGCLQERICNDTDTSSLLITLLRASGIPARYKKAPIIASKDQLTKLVRAQDMKAVFWAMTRSGGFAALPQDATIVGGADDWFDKTDFSVIETLYLEWTYVQMYYEYDERGANVSNTLDFSSLDSDQKFQESLVSYPKKSWVSIDASLKPSSHQQKQILQDSAGFHADAFLIDYLKAPQLKAPLDAYQDYLRERTGKEPKDFRSSWTLEPFEISILPPALPFIELKKHVFSGGKMSIEQETWSSLPDERKNAVTISLMKENTPILSHTLLASEISDIGITLDYQGFTEADRKVIEKAGGIHNTSASMVDIVPIFSLPHADIVGTVPVSIGENLVVQFAPFRGNKKRVVSQKTSIAGNREGIAMTFSARALQPAHLSTPSAILLEGNSAIAREYLKTIFQRYDIFAQSLDHQYGINFARAVVTQNRILTKDNNGDPSTFDFKGLFIDAAYEFFEYSSTQDYRAHSEKDFRYLIGMDGSFYESQTLLDLTGMRAISTISGLKHAIQQGQEYQVSLTRKDENNITIETVSLAQITGDQMKDKLEKGCITIAPNKSVTMGSWTGTLFVNLALNSKSKCGSDVYGIGEQAIGNGGYTASNIRREEERKEDDNTLFGIHYIVEVEDKKAEKQYYLYKDLSGKEIDSVHCRLSSKRFEEIQHDQEWKREFGMPCYEEVKEFGLLKHHFILSSDAAKFESQGRYSYWIPRQEVISILQKAKDSEQISLLLFRELHASKFKFNPIAGTYSWAGSYQSGATRKPLTMYYQPKGDKRGAGIIVYGTALEKLEVENFTPWHNKCEMWDSYCGKRNWVLNKLGYPIENRGEADTYWPQFWDGLLRQKDVSYQTFVGGQIYIIGEDAVVGTKAYYIPEPIASTYNSDEYCQLDKNGNVHCGSGGKAGYPTSDPILEDNLVTVRQNFEANFAISKKINQSSEPTLEYAIKYFCAGEDKNSEFLTGKALLEGLYDNGDENVKNALLFVGIPVLAGITFDAIFGTHGGASFAVGTAVGASVIFALSEIQQAGGFDKILKGVEARAGAEIKSAQCTSRQAYLVGRFAPEFAFFALGMKGFAGKSAKTVRTFSSLNALFAAQKLPRLREIQGIFEKRMDFFTDVLKFSDQKVKKIKIERMQELERKTAAELKNKDVALTEGEMLSITSQVYSERDMARTLGMRRWPADKDDWNTVKLPREPFKGEKFLVDPNGYLKLDFGKDAELYKQGEDIWLNIVSRDGEWFYLPEFTYTDKLANGFRVKEKVIHPQLVKGEDVDFAGQIFVRWNTGAKNWELLGISNNSGHYHPDPSSLRLLEYGLERSYVKMDNVLVTLYDPVKGQLPSYVYKKWPQPLE